jgi:plastocyanin
VLEAKMEIPVHKGERLMHRGPSIAIAAAATLLATLAYTQAPPAPTVDRVGFPEDYQTRFHRWFVYDRPDTRQVRTIYANDAANTVTADTQFNYPYGSVLVMETHNALRDPQGVPILDTNGRYQKDPAANPTIFVMRKERGFGEAYGPNRTGEWEYVAYRPDRSYQTMPQASAGCAICHRVSNQSQDWVFRSELRFINDGQGPVTDAVIHNYKFVPGEIRVKAGRTVTFYNSDQIEHTITDDTPGGGDTGRMLGGKSESLKFDDRGEFLFHCSLHPTMRGKVIVE